MLTSDHSLDHCCARSLTARLSSVRFPARSDEENPGQRTEQDHAGPGLTPPPPPCLESSARTLGHGDLLIGTQNSSRLRTPPTGLPPLPLSTSAPLHRAERCTSTATSDFPGVFNKCTAGPHRCRTPKANRQPLATACSGHCPKPLPWPQASLPGSLRLCHPSAASPSTGQLSSSCQGPQQTAGTEPQGWG